jgi:hypothetical protein
MLRQRTGAARFVPAPVTILAALVACAPAAAAPPLHLINRARPAAAVTATRALTTYGGSTSQDAPFALIVAKDHRRLSRLLLHADAPCSDGSHATESGPASIEAPGGARGGGRNLFVGNRLPKSGSFRVKGSATEGYGGTMYGKLSETLAGKVKGNRAKGTFRMTVQVIDANTGAVQATCDTGALSWRASAVPGKVYAGLTGTGRPVVVALTADRSMVSDLRIGWDATCQPEGGFLIADHLGNFPVDTSGTFGHPFDAGPFAASDGSSIALHYTLAGRLTATRATGTFAATMTQTAPDGTVQATCDRPLQHWAAAS